MAQKLHFFGIILSTVIVPENLEKIAFLSGHQIFKKAIRLC